MVRPRSKCICAPLVRLFLLVAIFVASGKHGLAQALPFTAALPTLTSVKRVHELTAIEAAKAYPVHIRAEVTYYDPYNDPRHAAMFIHDSTGGIYVLISALSSRVTGIPVPGAIIDITGVSAPGDYAAIIANPHIQVIGKSTRPIQPKPVRLGHLLTGVEDSQFVEIEGVVQSVFETQSNVMLDVAMQDGTISAMTVKESGQNYSRLLNSSVTIRGNASALFNHDRQLTGFRLMFPNLASVAVRDAGPQDPFSLPLRSINSLSRYQPGATVLNMVHLRGQVTLQWPGKVVCLEDGTQAICAQSRQTTALQEGQYVDVIGFPAVGGYRPTLYNAVYTPGGYGTAMMPLGISAQDAIHGTYDSRLVQIEGRLVGYDLASKEKTLLVSSGNLVFPAVLPSGSDLSSSEALKIGSKLRIVGVCAVELDTQRTSRGDGSAVTTSFRILLRSPRDLEIVQTPSWWTPAHSLLALGLSVAMALAILGWVAVLRRRVGHQTRLLRESEERFRHMAQHDALTGLPTRGLLHERLQIALEHGKRSGTTLAVLMVDLDNFKHVNDTFGHDAGDETLRSTAERILSAISGSDTAARMGGDEFIVLLPDIHGLKEAEIVAAKIRLTLSQPILAPGREIPISASIGVCTVVSGGTEAGMLLKEVDAAMYQAKARGRNRFEVFDSSFAASSSRRFDLQVALAAALSRNEFELQYQPMVSFETGEVTGFEALLRWKNADFGDVSPCEFIPIAEESGLIISIGDWVLREACQQIGDFERHQGASYLLAVNISPRHLIDPELIQSVMRAVEESKRPFSSLTIEITESMLLKDSKPTRDALSRLRELGVQVALDDFGIGFSSLSYITQFHTDWIKIDRSLICHCTEDRSSLAVLRAVVAMARALDIRLVAEGVETEEQYLLLKEEQCNVVQGYYFSRPLSLQHVPAFLALAQAHRSTFPVSRHDLIDGEFREHRTSRALLVAHS